MVSGLLPAAAISVILNLLIPSLLKNVDENLVHHDDIRFFEFGRTWQVDGDKVIENKSLAGVLFSKKK